jgi:Zn-dependent protease/CBS domain-containing protein
VGGFKLGKVFGFEIRVDFSWFIIFFLILWSFASAVFPAHAPGLSRFLYVVMGVAGAVLFFGSLLVHELSHSLVARAKGIPVDGITLFIFGGMAHTRSEAESPGDEFAIAGIGPVTSLLIAAALLALWYVGARAGWPPAITVVLQYIGGLNVLLAIFNLLPGFPLDGGRLFRALVWKLTGNLTKATAVASTAGRWLGYGLVAYGLLLAFRGNVFGGLWLVFIGWFLRSAAVASYRQVLVKDTLEGASARQAMTPVPQTVPADISLLELMDNYFLRRRFLSYPVVEDGGRAVGIVTLNQVKEVPGEEWGSRSVRDTMAPATEALVVSPEEDMAVVLDKLQHSPVRRVLVMRNGELEGIITAGDVTNWLERIRSLRD